MKKATATHGGRVTFLPSFRDKCLPCQTLPLIAVAAGGCVRSGGDHSAQEPCWGRLVVGAPASQLLRRRCLQWPEGSRREQGQGGFSTLSSSSPPSTCFPFFCFHLFVSQCEDQVTRCQKLIIECEKSKKNCMLQLLLDIFKGDLKT